MFRVDVLGKLGLIILIMGLVNLLFFIWSVQGPLEGCDPNRN